MKKCKLIIVILCLLSMSGFAAKGYEIKVKIPALKDSTLILAHCFVKENSFYVDDTIKLDKKGIGAFTGIKPLTGGMYIIISSKARLLDLLIGDNQVFAIETDTVNILKNTKFINSIDNKLFYDYKRLISSKSKEADILLEKGKSAKTASQKDSAKKALNEINTEVISFIKKTISENPGLFISQWLKSLQDIEVPDFPRDAKGNITDSAFRYNYWHRHFFDNFDISNPRMANTPFYEKKVTDYIEKVIPQFPDSIYKEVDMLLARTKGNDDLYRYMLLTLFGHYASSQIMGQDAIYAYIGERYYIPTAKWAKKEDIEKIAKDIAKIKPNIIGKVAPDFEFIDVQPDHFIVAKNDTAVKNSLHFGILSNLYNIKAKFLVLAFWEADCGHCQKAMPILYDSVYPAIKDKGVKIIAVHMLSSVEGKRKWVDFINLHSMYDWINAIPYSYEYKDLYNAYLMPSIYILDEDKRIIAKKIDPSQIAEIIDLELRKGAKRR